ncbi:MAG: DUF2794 domain-containing protein [Alphaproteobacteria bacterium]|nr:DUF2794 domain-containing protein [Alphaproteobacteria bacterium]
MLIISGTSQQQNASKKQKTGYFSRVELSQILNVYSLRVAAGEWRDYALDHVDGMAFFSIYRSSHEMPLYTIEKKRLKGKDRWLFILRDRRKNLRQAARLKDVLDYLDNLPRLVNN